MGRMSLTATFPLQHLDKDPVALAAAAIASWEEAHPSLQFESATRTELENGESFWTFGWWAPDPRHPTKRTGGPLLTRTIATDEPALTMVRSFEKIDLWCGIKITHVAQPGAHVVAWWSDREGEQHYQASDA